jgi:hypothetical protein
LVAVSSVVGGCASSGSAGSAVESAEPPSTRATLAPPEPGEYEFVVTSSSGTATRTLTVSKAERTPEGQRVTLVRETSSGTALEIFLWGTNDVTVPELRGTSDASPGAVLDCDWIPAPRYLKFPVRPSTRWSDTTVCGAAQSERHIESEVHDNTEVTVPAGTFTAWEITRHETVTVGSSTASFRRTEYFVPRSGLAVKVVDESLDDNGEVRSREVRELKSLP